MKWMWPALLLAAPLGAHIVSISTGELRITGTRASYELRMPLYEIQHVQAPEKTLLDQIRFSSGGSTARLTSRRCRADPDSEVFICTADYDFGGEIEAVQVECRLHTVTVPNHVHLLRAVRGDKSDQAIFDFSFPRAEIRFRPPTAFETVTRQFGAGAWRVVTGPAQILFLAALALAARARRELAAMLAAFLLVQLAACAVLPALDWRPAPRFAEAAAALTIAYLCIEGLLLPDAGKRWVVAGALGAFHGLYFALFLESGNLGFWPVMTGAILVQTGLAVLLGMAIWRLNGGKRVLSGLLFLVGLGWFLARLRS